MTNEELCMMIQTGTDTQNALEQLYVQNAGMIEKIIKRYCSIEDPEDLRQEAYFGIANAAKLWKPEKGASFINYATFHIRAAIRRYIDNCGSVIRIPISKRTMIGKYYKTVNSYKSSFGCDPSKREICALMGINLQQLEGLQRDVLALSVRSTSEPIGEDGESTLEDTIAAEGDPIEDTIDRLQSEELRAVLWSCVDDLEPKQAKVIRARYEDGQTMKECGAAMGCTPEYVRQLTEKALRELRHGKNVKRLRPYLTDTSAYNAGIRSSLTSFRNTYTSAQELAMMKLEERSGMKLYGAKVIFT